MEEGGLQAQINSHSAIAGDASAQVGGQAATLVLGRVQKQRGHGFVQL